MENEKKLKKNPLSFQIDPDLFDKASEEEKAQIVTQRESVSFMKDAMRRLVKNKIAMVCLFILIAITLIAIFVPMFYPYNYTQQDVTAKYLEHKEGQIVCAVLTRLGYYTANGDVMYTVLVALHHKACSNVLGKRLVLF